MTVTALLHGGPAHGQVVALQQADLELRFATPGPPMVWRDALEDENPYGPVTVVYAHYRRGPLLPLPGGHVPYYHVQGGRVIEAVIEADPDPADAAFDRLVAATDALLGTALPDHSYSSVDQHTYDFHADLCWRCDAVQATTDVGLCEGCRDGLKD